jgi:Choline dehydrogenase and related flavoproteins
MVAERRKAMIDITKNGVDFAVLEGQLLAGEIDRPAFLKGTTRLGIKESEATAVADKFLAIASNQAARQEDLKPSYDYVVVGSGAAGSVVARRLAENPKNEVLLLEAGEMDLKPNVLTTENWYFNMGGPMDWSFAAEPAAAVNNRSLHQAMGKALGGGTSINGMVWARGHKNDFEHWAKEAGDTSWGYQHVLDIYKRIEDWQGTPDPKRRGTGGPVFVQAPSDPNPLALAFLAAAESLGDSDLCGPERNPSGEPRGRRLDQRSYPRRTAAQYLRRLPLSRHGSAQSHRLDWSPGPEACDRRYFGDGN